MKYNFPDFEIERQVPCGNGQDKVDLVINVPYHAFEVGVELKLATDRNNLRNARAQVEDYSKFGSSSFRMDKMIFNSRPHWFL